MKNKKKWIELGIVIILAAVILFIIGRSFGFFKYAKEGNIINTIKINGIEVNILSKNSDILTFENAYPISDEDGLALTPFQFEVVNTTSRALTYQIKVVPDTEKLAECTLEDQSPCQSFTTDNIKFAYKEEQDEDYTKPAVLNNGIVTTVQIPANGTLTHSILLWIKDTAGNTIEGKIFYGKIVLEGTATENLE